MGRDADPAGSEVSDDAGRREIGLEMIASDLAPPAPAMSFEASADLPDGAEARGMSLDPAAFAGTSAFVGVIHMPFSSGLQPKLMQYPRSIIQTQVQQ